MRYIIVEPKHFCNGAPAYYGGGDKSDESITLNWYEDINDYRVIRYKHKSSAKRALKEIMEFYFQAFEFEIKEVEDGPQIKEKELWDDL